MVSPDPAETTENPVKRFITTLVKSSVPMVAAVEGTAIGIGATMLNYFDAVISAEEAKFLYPFINLALPPPKRVLRSFFRSDWATQKPLTC